MNSVILTKPAHIGYGQIAKPDPAKLKPNQVLIKVAACALNPSDILFMRGKYGVQHKFPFTPGWEGSGTVEAVGPGMLGKFLVGKRVGFIRASEVRVFKIGGGMAEYIVTESRNVIPLSDEISFE